MHLQLQNSQCPEGGAREDWMYSRLTNVVSWSQTRAAELKYVNTHYELQELHHAGERQQSRYSQSHYWAETYKNCLMYSKPTAVIVYSVIDSVSLSQ